MCIGKAETFAGHAVDIGCANRRGAVATEVAVADIVGINQHDIRPFGRRGGRPYEQHNYCHASDRFPAGLHHCLCPVSWRMNFTSALR